MPDLADRLADRIVEAGVVAGAAEPRVRGTDWRPAVVTAVNANGTVAVGDIVARRLDSYIGPLVGDTIALSRSGPGNWLAEGRLATGPDTWQDYTPVFGSASGGASLGNGTSSGRYLRAARRVDFEINVVFGSTTTFGSGSFSFTLPVTGASRSTGAGVATVRLARAAGGAYPAAGQLGTTTVAFIAQPTSTSLVSATTPWTWTTGDSVRISGTYEAAS